MKTLVVGATGATGKKLVQQLLDMDQEVKVIVRSASKVPETWEKDGRVTIIQGSIYAISVDEMSDIIQDCDAAASCLGHNLSFKGLYGKPRKLVTNAVQLVCEAVEKNAPQYPVKVVLMNTAGNRNRDLQESISFGERIVIGLIRLLLPPHVDNEKAADYLRMKIGQHHEMIEWVVVRPDTLMNEDQVSSYTTHPSPTTSAIFKPGKTSRINVGHFMARLIIETNLWQKWAGKMPVIYNNNIE